MFQWLSTWRMIPFSSSIEVLEIGNQCLDNWLMKIFSSISVMCKSEFSEKICHQSITLIPSSASSSLIQCDHSHINSIWPTLCGIPFRPDLMKSIIYIWVVGLGILLLTIVIIAIVNIFGIWHDKSFLK